MNVSSSSTTSGVLDYLQSALPPATLRQLYLDEEGSKARRGPFVCRAVLQQLSTVSQQVVARLACTGGQFPKAGVQAWIREHHHHAPVSINNASDNNSNEPSKSSHHISGLERVLKELHRWSMVETVCLKPDIPVVKLTDEFYQGVKDCFRHLDVCPWKAVDLQHQLPPGVTPLTTEDLERYTQKVWDAVLHFLVGSDSVEEPSAAVVNFLEETQLMQPDPEDKRRKEDAALVITEKGYDFMLQDQHRQVWLFVEQYLEMIKGKGEKFIHEALLLLICLSLARVGEAYTFGQVPKSARKMLRGWAHFGLVYLQEVPYPKEDDPKNTVTIFYPTRVATQMLGSTADDKAKLTTPASALWSLSSQALEAALQHPEPNDSAHLAIIVQTNFQVCAYTTSELHLRMLSLFCDVPSIRRLPNIIFLKITRDSVKGAFHLGIQARQILRFLEKNAHPKLRTRTSQTAGQGLSPVPANVVDQIWLWDRERSRVRMTEVYAQKCTNRSEYNVVLQFAKDKGAYVFDSPAKGTIYVNYKDAERIRAKATHYRAQIHAGRQQAESG